MPSSPKAVTLVYPAVSICGFAPQNLGFFGEARWIHHGLAILGACVKKAGHRCDLIDLRSLTSWSKFEEEIQWKASDVYGVSISYIDFKAGLKCCEIIKRVRPEAKVVVGGYAPSNFPDKFSQYEFIDYVVVGEGEVSFVELLESYPTEKVIKGVKPVLDELPFADRNLFGNYVRESYCEFTPEQAKPMVTMISGRACPYNCTYCQPAERSVFGKPMRRRSPHNVMYELEELYKRYKFKSITWWDDTFIMDKGWIEEFCDIYERYDFHVTMNGYSRADIICRNEEMVKRLASLGMDWCVIGFETGTQRLLDFLKKGTTVEQNLRAAEICHKYGVKVFGLFMLGLPTETKEESCNTMAMLNQIKPDCQALFYFTPIPSTHIYDYCKDNDLILRPDEEFFDIERTGKYTPRIRGIDYTFLNKITGYENNTVPDLPVSIV